MRVLSVCFASLLVLTLGSPTRAARRPIGAEKQQKVDLPDGDDDASADKKDEADAAKKAEAAAKKAEEAKQKAEAERQRIVNDEAKREAAEKAARLKAEEAKKKAEEEAIRSKAAAEKKKQDNADKRLRAELKAARAERVLVRKVNGYRIRLTLRPGAPEIKAVEEVRVDVAKILKVPDPRYGESKPLQGASLTATVRYLEAYADEKPVTKRKKRRKVKATAIPEPLVYRVHSLGDAGLYGFHTTLLQPGKYEVKVEGRSAEGERVEGVFDLYPGKWPPPDWEEERSRSTETTGRRRPITF